MTLTRVEVGLVENFPEGSITPLMVGGQELAVVCHEGRYFAMPDRCTHANFPLHDGELLDGRIKCSHHGATFDLESGRPTLPAVKKLRLFDTVVEDGHLFVLIQEA
jgi:3-phenylpropionate/trans-cinnamate dioxygenase ferredoxin subunit